MTFRRDLARPGGSVTDRGWMKCLLLQLAGFDDDIEALQLVFTRAGRRGRGLVRRVN